MLATTDQRLEVLRSAPLDMWIALSEDETKIIATGVSYAEVSRKSDEAGVADPLILKTPKEWLPLSL